MEIRRTHVEAGTAVVTAALGVLAIFGAQELGTSWTESGPQAGYFPFYVGLILIAASLGNLAVTLWSARRATRLQGPTAAPPEDAEEPFLDRERLGRILQFLLPMVAFVLITVFLGIYVGAALYITYSAWRQGGYRLLVALALGIGFAIALYLIFETAFRVPLLKGPVENLLGIY